jgi:hypothetical protein
MNPDLQTCAHQYAELSGIALDWERPLGHGPDGAVWKSHAGTAVKGLERERAVTTTSVTHIYDFKSLALPSKSTNFGFPS